MDGRNWNPTLIKEFPSYSPLCRHYSILGHQPWHRIYFNHTFGKTAMADREYCFQVTPWPQNKSLLSFPELYAQPLGAQSCPLSPESILRAPCLNLCRACLPDSPSRLSQAFLTPHPGNYPRLWLHWLPSWLFLPFLPHFDLVTQVLGNLLPVPLGNLLGYRPQNPPPSPHKASPVLSAHPGQGLKLSVIETRDRLSAL